MAMQKVFINSQKSATLTSKFLNIFDVTEKDSVNVAVELITRGEIVAVPTDTVYGLACRADDGKILEKLYSVKGRDYLKPLAICLKSPKDIGNFAVVDHLPGNLMNSLLPGPVTFILPCKAELHKYLVKDRKIGVRVPNFAFLKNICEKFGGPVALTSANVSNEQNPLNIDEITLKKEISAAFNDGKLSWFKENRSGSTIVDLSKPGYYSITREGTKLRKITEILQQFKLKELNGADYY